MRPLGGQVRTALLVASGLACLLAGCPRSSPSSSGPAEGRGGPDWIILGVGAKTAATQAKPMMVDFYTGWCHWCKKLDKETYADPRVMEKAKSFVCVKVDGEDDPTSAAKYNVEGYPTILLLDSSGRELHRVTDFKPAADFLTDMETALAKAKGGS